MIPHWNIWPFYSFTYMQKRGWINVKTIDQYVSYDVIEDVNNP